MKMRDIFKLLEERVGIVRSRNAITMLCCSIGGHFLNLQNLKQKSVEGDAPIQKQGTVMSLRNHLLFIRPSGFGKTLLLRTAEYMLPKEMRSNQEDLDISVDGERLKLNYNDNGGKVVKYSTTLTEAGAVGTYMEGRVKPGYFYECRQGFLLVEEFSAILNMFRSTHSSTFQQILLTALDSGKVNKRLAAGSLDYETQMTLMAGIQPAVVDVEAGAGLWRRFTIELYIPTIDMIEETKKASLESWSIEKSKEAFNALQYISDYIYNNFYETSPEIKGMEITDDFKQFLMRFNVPAALIDHYVKLAAGYHYFFQNIEEEKLIVDIDKYLKSIILCDYISRKLMLFNMASLLVLNTIQYMISKGYDDNHLKMFDIFEHCWHYQMSESELRSVLKLLTDVGILNRSSSINGRHLKIQDPHYLHKICNYIEVLQQLCAQGEISIENAQALEVIQ